MKTPNALLQALLPSESALASGSISNTMTENQGGNPIESMAAKLQNCTAASLG
jgi:hypothetical protein